MKTLVYLALAGASSGFVNGFFGTGGGLVIFYTLSFLGCDVKKSLATANFAILVLSLTAFFIYLKNGVLSFENTVDFLKDSGVLVVAGGIVGGVSASFVSPNLLKKIFSLLVIVCGIRMVIA